MRLIMRKILFGITGLTLGGAERVLVDIANKLSENDNCEITIFTLYGKGELEKQLSKKVKLKSIYKVKYRDLSKKQKILISLRILLNKKSLYKKYVKGDYDVEVAFLEGPITRLFSVKNKKVEKIAWVHNDISQVFGNGVKAKLKKHIDRKVYSKYRKIVFVSRDNLKKFQETYKDLRDEYLEPIDKYVIYNYIDAENVLKKAEEQIEIKYDNNNCNFLEVARLVPQKAIDRIIKVHKKLIENGLKHNFYVIGDGTERGHLAKQIEKYNVSETFHLLGKKENPYPYIKNADYFCLLSEFEGYGMVIEEAKILGKPILITDTAAREAVEKYDNAEVLENSEDGIYKGLRKVILQWQKKSNNAKSTDSEIKYDNSDIIAKIEKLLNIEK